MSHTCFLYKLCLILLARGGIRDTETTVRGSVSMSHIQSASQSGIQEFSE